MCLCSTGLIDRKVYKMRELRGAGEVDVGLIPTERNPADLFTKILSRQPFEKHRKTVLNLSAGEVVEQARKAKKAEASSE